MEYLEGVTLKHKIFRQAVGNRSGAGFGHPDRRRTGRGTLQGNYSSRHQAGQYLCSAAAGQAKILDFGLAKVTAKPESAGMSSPTLDEVEHLTSPGSAVGTVALYVAGAGTGEELDTAHRSFLIRSGSVRDGNRACSIFGRNFGR